jgi:protein arginine N-methyltransferase 1
MYSVVGYCEMMNDRVRIGAHEEALRQAIRPGDVVVDIGAGLGVMSFLACRLGAGRVYAIESADVIEVARALAVANGFAEQMIFLQDLSTRVVLPELADVIIADLRGVLPWFDHNIPSIIDARKRLLRPGGVLIPQRDFLWLGVVETSKVHRIGQMVDPWQDVGLDLNMDAAKRVVLNRWRKGRAGAEQFVTQPQCVAVLDYTTTEDIQLKTRTVCTATRSAVARGFNAWFDSELSAAARLSNGPGQPELIWGQAFFPWLEPVALTQGDEVTIDLEAKLVGDEYVWRWDTTVRDGQAGLVKASFRQSTFFGTVLSPATLRKGAAAHVPTLGEEGRVDLFALSLMDGQLALADIARQTAERFPERFPLAHDALTHVAELSKRYGR